MTKQEVLMQAGNAIGSIDKDERCIESFPSSHRSGGLVDLIDVINDDGSWDQVPVFTCAMCGAEFDVKEILDLHMIFHSPGRLLRKPK